MMAGKIFFFAFLLLSLCDWNQARGQSCLIKLKIPKSYYQCKKDSDCVIAGDACRSCGTPLVLNKKYKKSVEDMDLEQRIKKNCLIMCEACDQSWVRPKCQKNICHYVSKIADKKSAVKKKAIHKAK